MRLILLFLLFWWNTLLAQETKKDTVVTPEAKKDTIKILSTDTIYLKHGRKKMTVEAYTKRFDPRKALFYSAILPGAGQAYNKKYWKVPLVYGGLLGLIAVVKFYNDAEVKYKEQLFYNINHPNITYNPISGATTASLRTVVDQARRQRDYFSILTGMFYLLQMVDAHIDAHLKEFDINPNMHVRLQPMFIPSGVGMGLTLKF